MLVEKVIARKSYKLILIDSIFVCKYWKSTSHEKDVSCSWRPCISLGLLILLRGVARNFSKDGLSEAKHFRGEGSFPKSGNFIRTRKFSRGEVSLKIECNVMLQFCLSFSILALKGN